MSLQVSYRHTDTSFERTCARALACCPTFAADVFTWLRKLANGMIKVIVDGRTAVAKPFCKICVRERRRRHRG